MRLVQVRVPEDVRESVYEVLREEGVDFVATETADEDATVVEFPLPVQAVESFQQKLTEAGLDSEAYRVVVNAEAARTPNFKALEDRFVTGDEEDESISNEELRSKARAMYPGAEAYYLMTLLSVLVATAGLLLDSPAIVVGSMVIAPQVGAALMASVGASLREEVLFRDGMRTQVLGLVVSVAGATVFGLALQHAQFVPPALQVSTIAQISQRTSPGLLTLVVALAAGAAGGFGLATELPVSLVGVAVAAAIVPAAATVGIGLAWGLPAVAFAAAVVLLVNVVSINVAAVGAFRYLGFVPERGPTDATPEDGGGVAFGLSAQTVILTVVMLVVTAAAGNVLVHQISYENQTKTAVQELLDDEHSLDALELVSVQSGFVGVGGTETSRSVTVVVRRPADRPYPTLADDVERRIESRTESDVDVTVEFVDRTRSSD
ncbi:MAG: TIGR00341 family protein [Haloferacaceae archaeon]